MRWASSGSDALRQRLEVHAGAEVAAGAGEDADPQLVVLVEHLPGVGGTDEHRRAERVLGLGPVERDGEDVAVALDDECAWSSDMARRLEHVPVWGPSRSTRERVACARTRSRSGAHGRLGLSGGSMQLTDVDIYNPDIYVPGVPHEMFATLRREAPVTYIEHDGTGSWTVTKHDDIVTVNRDAKTFSSWVGTALHPRDAPGAPGAAADDDAQPRPARAHQAAPDREQGVHPSADPGPHGPAAGDHPRHPRQRRRAG